MDITMIFNILENPLRGILLLICHLFKLCLKAGGENATVYSPQGQVANSPPEGRFQGRVFWGGDFFWVPIYYTTESAPRY